MHPIRVPSHSSNPSQALPISHAPAKLNDPDIEAHLVQSVKSERDSTANVLRYLKELEASRLYLKRGYTSLFAYCTQKLGYSEPEAHLRIQSMRLMQAYPEVEKKLEKGELNMSVAARIQGAARRRD